MSEKGRKPPVDSGLSAAQAQRAVAAPAVIQAMGPRSPMPTLANSTSMERRFRRPLAASRVESQQFYAFDRSRRPSRQAVISAAAVNGGSATSRRSAKRGLSGWITAQVERPL